MVDDIADICSATGNAKSAGDTESTVKESGKSTNDEGSEMDTEEGESESKQDSKNCDEAVARLASMLGFDPEVAVTSARSFAKDIQSHLERSQESNITQSQQKEGGEDAKSSDDDASIDFTKVSSKDESSSKTSSTDESCTSSTEAGVNKKDEKPSAAPHPDPTHPYVGLTELMGRLFQGFNRPTEESSSDRQVSFKYLFFRNISFIMRYQGQCNELDIQLRQLPLLVCGTR